MRRLLPVIAALSAVALVALAWILPNLPQKAGPPIPDARFQSLSFAPFRDGQSPVTGRFPSRAEAAADMALLAPMTRAIRTYASSEGDWSAPELAAPLGLKVWQGIWLGRDRVANEREIAHAVDLANRWPEVVDRVVVGNEVLLRREMPVAELAAYLDRVRAAVRQPVTYADVWENWLEHPELADHVDVVTVHLLPFWEDRPTGIDRAVDHVASTFRRMRDAFPGKQIAIGETGWPSAGRAREEAVPGRVNQAAFVRGFVAVAEREDFEYNLIEAFDQGWKHSQEGTMGAAWGIFDQDRRLKFPLEGPVVEDPRWPRHLAISLLAAFALLVPVLLARGADPARLAGAAFLAVVLGGCLGYAQANLLAHAYDWPRTTAAWASLALQGALAWLAVRRAAAHARGEDARLLRTGADATATFRGLLRLRLPRGLTWGLDDLLFAATWWAAANQILLVVDPRYMDFPFALYSVPVAVTLWAAMSGLLARQGGREEFALGAALALGAVGSVLVEGMSNHQALAWAACALILAAGMLLGRARRRVPTITAPG